MNLYYGEMSRARPERKTHSVSATLGDERYEQLVALCRAEDTSIARIVRRALDEFLESGSGDSGTDLSSGQRQRA